VANPTPTIAGFLPDVELRSVPDGVPDSLGRHTGSTTVLFTVHSASCAACRDYLAMLADASAEFQAWDARLLVIVPASPPEAATLRAPFGQVLGDEHLRIADPASASLIVADRYGQVFHAVRAGTSHDLPPRRELDEWLKFLGTLCPE
jgi:hypothetical protein